MEKFFEAGTLGEEDLIRRCTMRSAKTEFFRHLQLRLGNVGADRVMDFSSITPPRPPTRVVQGEAGGNGDAPKRHESDEEPVSLYVFAPYRMRCGTDSYSKSSPVC